jgi:peptide-methionine (R)-S-oxide reductase
MDEKRTKQELKQTEKELRKRLTGEQYRVTQERATEPPYSNKYWDCEDDGVYECVCCGAELFRSEDKFDSGCGWPSFSRPAPDAPTKEAVDTSLDVIRTEVVCGDCGAHLGHVFREDTAPNGMRYCINSASLNLERRKQ